MAEYWKSLPRKFCDICKCWFADNKASIDFHERGKRHKENAQKRIQEIQKRGIKEFKKQQELENEMEKIERAALAAYKKDLQNMQGEDKSQTSSIVQPTNTPLNSVPQSNVKLKTSQKKTQQKEKTQQEVVIKQEPVSEEQPTLSKVWYEAITDEGYKYYWNSETSESRWEPPEEGYISVEEQNALNSETVVENERQQNSSSGENIEIKEEKLDECIKVKEEKLEEDISCSIGPQPKFDPYGQWITVEKKEPVKYDLQLPKPSENVVEIVIPVHKDDSFKIKEKVIGQLSDSDCADVTFKKRKFTGSLKRNARQRIADDD